MLRWALLSLRFFSTRQQLAERSGFKDTALKLHPPNLECKLQGRGGGAGREGVSTPAQGEVTAQPASTTQLKPAAGPKALRAGWPEP
eukprot:1264486-Rhodomonas_salina.2